MNPSPALPSFVNNTFTRIRRVTCDGQPYWSARALAGLLDCGEDRLFEATLARARTACADHGHTVARHFVGLTHPAGSRAALEQPAGDWALSLYACCLIIQNFDSGQCQSRGARIPQRARGWGVPGERANHQS